MPENMSDKMPEYMSDRTSENMSDRMPENMSDKMLEDLLVTKYIYINIMVGIIWNKAIWKFIWIFIGYDLL